MLLWKVSAMSGVADYYTIGHKTQSQSFTTTTELGQSVCLKGRVEILLRHPELDAR